MSKSELVCSALYYACVLTAAFCFVHVWAIQPTTDQWYYGAMVMLLFAIATKPRSKP